MIKISEYYKSSKEPVYSLEFFPPKTEVGEISLYNTLKDLKFLNPSFVTVTYGAGGSTREKTIGITNRMQNEFGLNTASHLTCVGSNKKEMEDILQKIHNNKIRNIMALRGDPPKGEKNFIAVEDGFSHASELMEFIKIKFPDFCLGGGCYPEKHCESKTLEEDVKNLKIKEKNGAEFLITQLFFKNELFEKFLDLVIKFGISIPIIPGIMPISNFNQIERFKTLSGCEFPKELIEKLELLKDYPPEFEKASIEFTVRQCRELLKLGVRGIHLYTLNQSKFSYKILKELKS